MHEVINGPSIEWMAGRLQHDGPMSLLLPKVHCPRSLLPQGTSIHTQDHRTSLTEVSSISITQGSDAPWLTVIRA